MSSEEKENGGNGKESLLKRIRRFFYASSECPYHKFTRFGKLRSHSVTLPKAFRAIHKDTDGFWNLGILKKTLGKLIGNSLILDDGPSWQATRQIMNGIFTRENVSEKIAPIMLEECDAMIGRWEKQKDIADTEHELLKTTGRIIMRSIFSDSLTDRQYTDLPLKVSQTLSAPPQPGLFGKILKLVNIPYEHIGFLPVLALRALGWRGDIAAPVPKSYLKALEEVDAELYPAIAARRKLEKQPHDIVGQLIDAVRPDTGKPFTDGEIKDQVVMLIAAGHETTAESLTFSLKEILKRPDVQMKLRDEFNAVTGGRPLAVKDFARLNYTQNTLKEAMRLHPPVYMSSREAMEDRTIEGMSFKKGDWIRSDLREMHKNPDFWTEPEAFRPERFEKDRFPQAYLAFGSGPRACLGMNMSMVEGTLFLAMMLNKLDMEIVREPKGERYYFTTRPDSKMAITAAPRR